MQAALVPSLFVAAAFAASSAFALSTEQGGIVQGKYFASGNASVAGVKVQYSRSKAHITNHGKIRGRVIKIITSGGRVLSSGVYKIRGTVGGIQKKGRTFTAPAKIQISDGVKVRGDFHGLVDKSQRLSRYFRGEISGDKNSNFVLRAR
ncbi:MAG: hypothetical protein ACREKL_07500 [Chthoniobacterales bacterium]